VVDTPQFDDGHIGDYAHGRRMKPTTVIKGWCPGALRPMESGDGLIVRLKITGGIVPIALAAKIADWSRRWGNGEIDLTSRANLQLRGVTAQTLPSLQDALASAGLVDADTDGEAVRNVIASPLAGLDPDAVLDIRPLVRELELRLAGDAMLHDLPAKFGFSIDDGGRFSLDEVRADVRFEALPGLGFDIWLDGKDKPIGSCRPDQLVETAAAIARVFISCQGADVRRMRDLVAHVGAESVAAQIHNFSSSFPRKRESIDPPSRCSILDSRFRGNDGKEKTPLDRMPQRDMRLPSARWGEGLVGSLAYLGVGLPFGRIAANELSNLTERALENGAAEFRLTTWRAILIPLPSVQSAHALAEAARKADFVLDSDDPRRRVAACVGAPSCPKATTGVREDAARLARLANGPGIALHVSGCTKGCAHPRVAPVTLVGNHGRYDLVIDGASADSPLARGLTLDEAAGHLRQMAPKQPQGEIA
jgi:precorrin-3B synthase